MEGMFLKDKARWVAAARHHFAAWERKERYIFAHMTPRVSLEGVTSAGGYYRIGRHFPIERRRRLVALIEEVASLEGLGPAKVRRLRPVREDARKSDG